MNIMWCITGAGHLLKESIETMKLISKKHDITIILSKAGEEVIKKYGYYDTLKRIQKDPNKIIKDKEQEYSYPISGKITNKKQDLIVVTPTTANTTAKIVNGIADNLVTNVVAQAGKSQIETIIVPVDQKEGLVSTILPIFLDLSKCRNCTSCKPEDLCPQKAFKAKKVIDQQKCDGCNICYSNCKYDAVILDKVIKIYIRKIDADNTTKLENIESITTVFDPKEIPEHLNDNI